MPVGAGDIGLWACLNNNNDETSTQGGAINSSIQYTGNVVGELMQPPITTSNPVGGVDRTHYKKYCLQNSNATFGFGSVALYFPNLMIPIVTTGTVSLVSSSTSDTGSVLLVGYDGSGPNAETIVMNGTTPVSGTINWVHLQSVENSGDTAFFGNVTVKDHGATVLCVIPGPDSVNSKPGYHSATGEIQVGFDLVKNGNLTTTNSLTPPTGISFSVPNTLGTALTLPGDGNLDAGDYIGIWIKLTTKAGLNSRTDIEWAHFPNGVLL